MLDTFIFNIFGPRENVFRQNSVLFVKSLFFFRIIFVSFELGSRGLWGVLYGVQGRIMLYTAKLFLCFKMKKVEVPFLLHAEILSFSSSVFKAITSQSNTSTAVLVKRHVRRGYCCFVLLRKVFYPLPFHTVKLIDYKSI